MGGRAQAIGCLLFLLLELCTVTFAIEYNTGAKVVPGKLNVHLVPHTHDDVGWQVTVDQYFELAVKSILDTTVGELQKDPNRLFSYVEQAFFQRWWRIQNDTTKDVVRGLVATGQLEFINGGWCMHDEAAAHYVDMIDQTTLGHRYIKNQFGVTPRIGWQIDPFGHSAAQAYLMGAEMGFDSLFFARMDYQDKAIRQPNKTMELIWRASKSLGSSAEIFTGAFYGDTLYFPPPTFDWDEFNDPNNPSIDDDKNSPGYNVTDRINDAVQYAQLQAADTRANHIMWTMGGDFMYSDAITWFSNMDKLIHYGNLDGRVNFLYSTPSIYTDAKHAANLSWTLKTDDYLPYADDSVSYWAGYFTSRPGYKGYVRSLSSYLQAGRQLEFIVGRNNSGFTTDSLEDAMGIAQHHDSITGTAKQAVSDDYTQRLALGAAETEKVVTAALSVLTQGEGSAIAEFVQCPLLNVSYCPATETSSANFNSSVVTAYNSLGWARSEYIRLPVNSLVQVTDFDEKIIPCQMIPVDNKTINLREFYVEANLGIKPDEVKYWVVFEAEVPALGFSSFRIQPLTDLSKQEKPGAPQGLSEEATFKHKASSVNVSNSYYKGVALPNAQDDGAYIFLPDSNQSDIPVYETSRSKDEPPIGDELVHEVYVESGPWVSQVFRNYLNRDYTEVEFTIGPIPIDDKVGKDVITRFATDLQSQGTFYSDSNGRDFLTRVRNFRPTWHLNVTQPIAGNYYPVGLGIHLQDENTGMDLSVLVDRAVGGTSLEDGELEIMLHRRLVSDDGRGVGEALNETVCINGNATCEGLTIRGSLYFRVAPESGNSSNARWRRKMGQEVYAPLQLAFTTEGVDSNWMGFHTPRYSILPDYTLPENVIILTLQKLEDTSTLLRLAHIYEVDEDPELSEPATIDLVKMFYLRTILNATELTLTANQKKSDVKLLKWNVERDSQKRMSRGKAFNDQDMLVELGPSEIRTFQIHFE